MTDEQLREIALSAATKLNDNATMALHTAREFFAFLKGAQQGGAAQQATERTVPVDPLGKTVPLVQIPASSIETGDMIAELARRGYGTYVR